jgi:hypothetical protein
VASNFTLFSVELRDITPQEASFLESLFMDDAVELVDTNWDSVRRTYSIVSQEYSNPTPDEVADLLQIYLQRYHPDGCLAFEWAHTHSRMRPGEIGGGAAFITANLVTFLNTGTWVSDMISKYNREKGGT